MTGLLSVAGSTASDSGFELKSLRFNEADSAALYRTNAAGNRKTATWSFWVKPEAFSTSNRFMFMCLDGTIGTSGNEFGITFPSNDCLELFYYPPGSYTMRLVTNQVFRDPSAWYHILCNIDTTQATSSNRAKIYVNGSQVTSFSTETYMAQNSDTSVNKVSMDHWIGRSNGSNYFPGYLAEYYFIDGAQLTPASFGETNEDTNQWQPKNPTDIKPTLTFGTNGFYLPFSNDALADSFTDSAAWGGTKPDLVRGGGNLPVTKTGTKKFGTASAFFDVTAAVPSAGQSYLSSTESIYFGTGDFTVEFFALRLADPGTSDNREYFFSSTHHDGTSYANGGFAIRFVNAATGTIDFVMDNTLRYNCEFDMTDGSFHHIALQRRVGEFEFYIDGNKKTSTTHSSIAATQVVGNTKSNNFWRFSASRCDNSSIWSYDLGFNGYLDEFRASNICRYSGATYTVPTTAFTLDSNTETLMHMDGSDDGTSFPVLSEYAPKHIVTAYGDTKNTRISNHSVAASGDAHIIGPKVGASAIAFDGTDDYLSVASSTDFDFGTGDFTLEMWCNSSNLLTTTHVYLFDMRDGTSRITITSNAASSNGIWFGDGWGNITDWQFPTDEWFHIAVCRQSGTGRAYLNGVLKSSVSSFTTNFGGTWTTHIGDKYNNDVNSELKGYLDEIRLSNTARYPDGTTFTPSTTAFTSDANTKLLIHSNTTMGSTTFTDSSSGAHTITANGDVMNVAQKIGTGMAAFDGSGDYLSSPDSIDWTLGSNFTIETWVNFGSVSSDLTIINQWKAQGTLGAWALQLDGGNTLKFFYSTNGTSAAGNSSWSWTPTLNTWYHLAIVRDGADLEFYLDGTLTGGVHNIGTSVIANITWPLDIGYFSYLAGYSLNGYLDEMRISNITRYTGTFTPSTTAFKDDKDTVLLLHMDGGGGIDAETNLPTLAGQGTYFWDASTNAIFYGADGIPTNKSIISFDGTGDYLNAGSSTDWDFGSADFTLECWVNVNALPDQPRLFGDSGGNWFFRIGDCGGLKTISAYNGNWFCDDQHGTVTLGAWHHFAWSRASATNRFFFDGNLITDTTITDASMSTTNLYIGGGVSSMDIDGYMDQIRVSNTARYTSTFTPSTTPFTADANTKLLIQSDFSEGGLGADHSGNYNLFTATNLGVDDMMLDSPMNNFCTLNPLPANYGAGPRNTYQTMSEGNLKTMGNTATDSANVSSTIAFTEGKWYFECYVVGVSASYNYPRIGMIDTPNTGLPSRLAGEANTLGVTYQTNGEKGIAGTFSSYGDTFTTGDVVGMAIDADNGAAYFSKNGTWQNSGVPTSGASKTNAAYTYTGGSIEFTPSWIPYTTAGGGVANFGQDSSFAGNLTSQGNQDGNSKGDFYYSVPSGYLALCTDNLSAPLISAVEALDYFNTVAYSGDGTTPRTLNAGFQPDFTWLKIRTVAWSHRLFDSIRGANLALYSNSNAVQAAGTSGYLSGFASTGPTFTGNGADVRDVNETGDTYVTWNWKAGGAPTVDNSAGAGNTPTAGSVKINGSNLGSALAGSIATTRLSANTTAGFSISTYTGNSTAGATIAHGLSQAPDIAFFKELTYVDNWVVFAEPLGNTKALFLDTANDAGTHTTYWNDTSPNATVITLGTDGKANSARTHIMYAFHSVEGYSKVGSYTGNGNVDGTFVYTGFRPAYVLWKSTTASENWQIKDNKRLGYNQQNHTLFANDTAIDYTTAYVDLVSNGFKLRISGGGSNGTNEVLMYIAFAESPFKTSNAR